jgi:hypothetical protein
VPVLAEVFFTVESGLLILALMILIGPLLAERVRVPGLIGLIFLGMVFGPFVLEWLRPAGMVASVGAIGLLYLMFMAGMDLDINTFVENRRAAITFGLLTFVIPFSISFIVGYRLLDYTLAASALVGVARRAAAHRQVEIEVFTAESWIIDDPDDYTSVRVHDRQSPRPLAAVKDGDLVVVPPHLIDDTLPLEVRRMAKLFDNASLVVVGGPKRLHVSSVVQEEGLAGLVGWSKRDRAGTPAR